MLNYFIRRFLLIIPTFLGCTLLVFTILQFTPGGPFERALLQAQSRGGETGAGGGNNRGTTAIPEQAKEELKKYFGLDQPIHVRYFTWLSKVVTLDLGESYVYSEPVWSVISSRFGVSIYFGLIGFFLSYLVCIPLGILKGLKHGSPFDIVSSAIVFIGYSIPGWALGGVLLTTLSLKLGWFPLGEFHSDGWESMNTMQQIGDLVHHTILPVFCYMIGGFATLTILMKNSLMENLGQDYVRTAFAKGLPERKVIFVHALRNSLIPIITGLGYALTLLLTGALLIERVFNIQGIGLLEFQSVVNRDYTVVMGLLVITVFLQMIGKIMSDLLYAVVDPRIRFD